MSFQAFLCFHTTKTMIFPFIIPDLLKKKEDPEKNKKRWIHFRKNPLTNF